MSGARGRGRGGVEDLELDGMQVGADNVGEREFEALARAQRRGRRHSPADARPSARGAARRRMATPIETYDDDDDLESISEEEFAREARRRPSVRRVRDDEDDDAVDPLARGAGGGKRRRDLAAAEEEIASGGLYPIFLLAAAIVYTVIAAYLSWDPNSIHAERVLQRESGAGTIFNQVFWLGLAAACAPLALQRIDALIALVLRHWILFALIAWCWISLVWSIAPDVGFRRALRLTIVVGCLTMIAAAVPSARDMFKACLIAMTVIVFANFATMVLTPGIAFNSVGEFIGVHTNKNVCGAFGLVAATIFAYAAIRTDSLGAMILNGALALAAFAILILSGSKTSFAIPFLVIPFTVVAGWAARRDRFSTGVVFTLAFMAVLLFALFVWGIGPSAFAKMVFGDETLTGRTYIWDFLVDYIGQAPLLGYGYASFWSIGAASPNLVDGVGVVARISQGHNGYLDLLVTVGPVGLLFMAIALGRVFMGVLRHAGEDDETVEWAGVALALAATALIHNVTESSLLRADHLIWVMTVIAILYSPPGPKRVIAQARVDAKPERKRGSDAKKRGERVALRRDTDL